jgi:hypothetical protein
MSREINININSETVLAVAGAAALGGLVLIAAAEVAKTREEMRNPTPILELSNNPDEVVFKARTEPSIQKGIKAAMEMCKYKNKEQGPQDAEGISTIKVGCEPGTLKTSRVTQQRGGESLLYGNNYVWGPVTPILQPYQGK